MNHSDRLEWLLEGDPAVVYMVHKYILKSDDAQLDKLQRKSAASGWGKAFLDLQDPKGHWGRGFYQPKWTSTHYTLLDLRNLHVPKTAGIERAIHRILHENKAVDGGINPHRELGQSDVCINGMFLRYACYYDVPEQSIQSVVDFTLSQAMTDGGYNCRSNRSGATHSSVHTTISALEGFHEYLTQGYTYRKDDVQRSIESCQNFLLKHRLFKSDRTGEIIHKSMTMLSYPCRWKYDILRAMEYFVDSGRAYESRMDDAVEVLVKKKRKDGTWPVQAKHPGNVHFDLEETGRSSRINTIRALRVLAYARVEDDEE